MRIRQVRPEFFADPLLSSMSVGTRLTYIGLWCIADDAGWLGWDARSIAAQLYPYESVRVRERRVEAAFQSLVESGRLTVKECGCAVIPTLEDHQKIGGNKSFSQRDKHDKSHKSKPVHTVPDVYPVSYVGSELVKSRERATNGEDAAYLAGLRKLGVPVDA